MKLNKKQLAQLIAHGKTFEKNGETLRGFVLGLWNKGDGIDPSEITDALKKADLTRAESTVRNWIYAEKKSLGLTNPEQEGQANPAKANAIADLEVVTADMDGTENAQTVNEICMDFIAPFVGVAIDAKFDAKKPRGSIIAVIKAATQAALRSAREAESGAKEADAQADAAKDDAAKDAKADADAKANAKADKNGTPKGGKRKGGTRKTAPAKATA